mgnify:FL=1
MSPAVPVLDVPAVPLEAVPRYDVWVVCPRCAGPAYVSVRDVLCTRCTWLARGASPGYWCGCCQKWEGDRPSPASPVPTRLTWRCPTCGRRESTSAPLTARARPTRRCACGTAQTLTGRRPLMPVAQGVDALYGLPFYLSTPCAGHVLWVANAEHARYLERYVGARIRPRRHRDGRLELGHFLPAWITSGHNRDTVLRALTHLLARAAELDRR